jgi:hypothetical protein
LYAGRAANAFCPKHEMAGTWDALHHDVIAKALDSHPSHFRETFIKRKKDIEHSAPFYAKQCAFTLLIHAKSNLHI